MNGFATDLRTALRSLRGSPGATALVVLTLATGIAAATVIFSAVEGVLINPLRLDDADRYVSVLRDSRTGGIMVPPSMELAELWSEADSFEALEVTRWTGPTWTGNGPAVTVAGMEMSAGLPGLLGVPPLLGRSFTVDETEAGGPDVAVLAYGTWVNRFDRRRDVVGETVTLDGRPHTIIGVVPADFALPMPGARDVEMWLPLRSKEGRSPVLTGKLREGVTPERAAAELESLMAGSPAAETWKPAVLPAADFVAGDTSDALRLLMGAVGVLLLIATLNVTNLLLGRAQSRRRETAVRAALGGTRGRIARPLMLESLVLGLASVAAGVVLAQWGLWMLTALRPDSLTAFDAVSLNPLVLGFAGAVALACSLLVGLAPAVSAASDASLASLRIGSRVEGGGRAGRRFRFGLVVAEVALSVILLVGAGLLVRTLGNLAASDPGFEPERVVRVDIEPPAWKYPESEARVALASAIRERLAAVPGVEAVGVGTGAPPRAGAYFGALEIEGRGAYGEANTVLHGNEAGPDYFAALGQPIVAGRAFTAEEVRDGAPVYIVGEQTAAAVWGDADPVGSRIRLGEEEPWATVVGVARNVAITGLGRDQRFLLYGPAAPETLGTWLVRTGGEAAAAVPAIRQAMATLDLDLVVKIEPVANALRASVDRQRFVAVLLLSFAAVATLLAAVGFYGVLSNLVIQRRREIGIRMAVGATRHDVLGIVVRRALAATGLGVGLGAPAAFAASAFLDSQLYGIGRADPTSYVMAGTLLVTTALVAAWLPARQAAAVDPVQTINAE